MAAEALSLRRPVDFRSRLCPVTGLVVDQAAERLVLTNAATAVVFLLVGGLMAVFIALTRGFPGLEVLSPEIFYRMLTAHGMNMLIYWIIFFEIAGLYFGAAIALNARLVQPTLAWIAYGLMIGGALLTNIMILLGQGDVMFSSYVPLKAHPLFYLGTILFALGAIIGVGLFFATVMMAKAEKRYTGSVPVVTYGLMTAAIIATFTLFGGVVTFVPAFFWSLGLINLDPEVYRLNFWSIGHSSQQINLAAMVSIWYLLAYITTGAKPINEKLTRFAFVFYILFINLGSVHHLLVDPGLSIPFKLFNTSYAMYLAVLGSMIHAFSIPAAVEAVQRAKGYTQGLFGWLRNAPWREPGFSSLAISMVIFGFIGGTTGVVMGHEQINMIWHNTLAVPGHFHATVVGGTTIAFMGLTYYVIPLLARRELILARWVRWQPYIYGSGIVLLSIGMMAAGWLGVPRRVADISYSGAPIPVSFPEASYAALAVFGVGALISLIGGAMYIVIAVGSLFFGKKTPETQPKAPVVPQATAQSELKREHKLTGTMTLVFVFLAFFIVVLLWNMAKLAGVWPVK
jgi:cytochrome c oxidase subunit 1